MLQTWGQTWGHTSCSLCDLRHEAQQYRQQFESAWPMTASKPKPTYAQPRQCDSKRRAFYKKICEVCRTPCHQRTEMNNKHLDAPMPNLLRYSALLMFAVLCSSLLFSAPLSAASLFSILLSKLLSCISFSSKFPLIVEQRTKSAPWGTCVACILVLLIRQIWTTQLGLGKPNWTTYWNDYIRTVQYESSWTVSVFSECCCLSYRGCCCSRIQNSIDMYIYIMFSITFIVFC